MPGFEEEAFARAQRIKRASRENTDSAQNHSSHEENRHSHPRPESAHTQPPPERKEPERAMPEESGKKPLGLLDTLFKDKEKSIILALLLLISDEDGDPSMLLALAYLLI